MKSIATIIGDRGAGHGDSLMTPSTEADHETMRAECLALGHVIDRIGDKWTVMVVGHLSTGAMRFNALMRAVPGISHRMLTLTLRGLQRDGLVKRTAFPTIPPRVDYELTELGQSLTGPLSILADWASRKRQSMEAAQREYDREREPEASR